MNTLLQLQAATLAARARLGDNRIGTRAEAGKVQVVRVPENDDVEVEPVSEWLTPAEAVQFLERMA